MNGQMNGVLGHLCAYIGLWAKLEPKEHLIIKRTSRESICSISFSCPGMIQFPRGMFHVD